MLLSGSTAFETEPPYLFRMTYMSGQVATLKGTERIFSA
jgi:hypothetical protein